MRTAINDIRGLGEMPASTKDARVVEKWEIAVNAIDTPVTDQEAVVLLGALPKTEGDCFGLAWSMLHAIETASGYCLSLVENSAVEGEWKNLLITRLENANGTL